MRHRAYRDDANLAVRHHLHSYVDTPPPSPRGRIFAAFEPRGDETVVDVGCGNGQDLRALAAAGHRGRLIGLDISTGMLGRVDVGQAELICADAADLPLVSEIADVVLAMSMLYHVAEIDRALGELRRVLKPSGVFLASASSPSNMPEFIDAWERATLDVVGRSLDVRRRWERTFNTANGADILSRVFSDVVVHDYEWRLEPPNPGVVRRYAESSRDFYADAYERGTWEEVMRRLESIVEERFRDRGQFPITIRKGIFVARPG